MPSWFSPFTPVAAVSCLLQEDGSSFEEGMLKLLRTLPKVLKYLPSDKAKDARNFMMSFQVCTHCCCYAATAALP